MPGLPYLRKLSFDDFEISVILSLRVLKYGNISQKSWELNTRTFSFKASCAQEIFWNTLSGRTHRMTALINESAKRSSSQTFFVRNERNFFRLRRLLARHCGDPWWMWTPPACCCFLLLVSSSSSWTHFWRINLMSLCTVTHQGPG